MTTKKFLVNTMFINILTAGIFSLAMMLTACSDDATEKNTDNQKVPTGADTRLLEAYGLIYTDFEKEGDVQILNADTTEIAVSKHLADKLGITSFVGHPMGIWQAIDELPYARKTKEERLVGDMWILTVERATVAELIGDKSAKLSTSIYVNDKPQLLTRGAAGFQMSEYAARYVDESGITHPAVVHLTDPMGYDKPYHKAGEQPLLTRGKKDDGHYSYYTAEQLLQDNTTRGALGASMHVNVLQLKTKIEFDHDFHVSAVPGDTLNLSGKIPIDYSVNYFMTLEGGVRWDSWLPEMYVKKFETGLDGNYSFSPECYLAFKAKANLKKDLERLTLASFGQYTFTFVVGVVPICIVVKPSLYMKFKAGLEGGARIGFKYDYANRFKAGIRYQEHWSTIQEFEELKNEFKLVKPEVFFAAEAGVGFYLGVDVMIYGVTGPEIAIGPNLTTKLSYTSRPFEGVDQLFDFKASVDLKIHAFAGAKISLLGYDLAKWTTDIDIAGPWNLFKYPSDGTEHKDPAQKQQEDKNALWNKTVQVMAGGSQQFIEEYEDMITQLINMNGWTREETVTDVANSVLKNFPISEEDLTKLNIVQKIIVAYNTYKSEVNANFNRWSVSKHMSEMESLVRGNRAFKTYSKQMKGWAESIDFTELGEEFQRLYNRLPEPTSDDLRMLLEMTLRAGEIHYNRHHKDTPMWRYMELYLDQHNYNRSYPTNIQARAKFDTIFISEKYHKRNVEDNANWQAMADDYNQNIRTLYEIEKAGIPIPAPQNH